MIVELYNTIDHTLKNLESEYGVTSATVQRGVKYIAPMSSESSGSILPKNLPNSKTKG